MTPRIASVTITFENGRAVTLGPEWLAEASSAASPGPGSRPEGLADTWESSRGGWSADRARHRWTEDDEIVTLDIYTRLGLAGADHPEVVAAAELIGTTPASVNMRLGNQQAAASGGTSGLTSVAKLTVRTWQEWSHRLEELPTAAAAARRRLAGSDPA